MESALFCYLISSEQSESDEKVVRRQLRDKSNPLSLPKRAFIKRFRLNKEAFKYVLLKLSFHNQQLSTAVPPVLQLASTLSLLASGSYQHSVGNDYLIGLAQSTVSKFTSIVLQQMEENLCQDFIKFNTQDSRRCKEWFLEKYGIPGVIGCIDGTHIGFQKPSLNEHMFLNRKGLHSLNAMIIAINWQYGGAAHDSFIWKHSDQRRYLEDQFYLNQNQNSWLLGDSGYPLEPWCITPYRTPLEGSSESLFNEVHSKARCMVERTIGILKGRWRIMGNEKKCRYKPEKVAKLVNAFCALHNVCIKFKIPFNLPNIIPEDEPIPIEFELSSQLTRIGEKIINVYDTNHTINKKKGASEGNIQ